MLRLRYMNLCVCVPISEPLLPDVSLSGGGSTIDSAVPLTRLLRPSRSVTYSSPSVVDQWADENGELSCSSLGVIWPCRSITTA